MSSGVQILIDTPDTGDVPPGQLQPLVEQLREELPEYNIHIAWEGKSDVHIGDYWPEIILWVAGDKDLAETTVRVILITKATEWALRRGGKLCIKLARFTGENAGKVFKKRYIEPDKEPVDEDVNEDEQETVTKPPIRD